MTTINEAFEMARDCHQRGDFAQAEQLCRLILQSDSSLAEVWCQLGTACQAQGKLAEAEINYRRTLQLSPYHAKAANRLGVVLSIQGRHMEAVAVFRQNLKERPDNSELHNNLGVVYTQLQQIDNAIQCYQQAIHCQPDYAEAHYNLGLALRSQGQHDAAESEFRQAVKCKTDYPQAWNDLGNVLMEQGRLAEAMNSYTEALKIRPGFADAHSNLGIVLDKQGRFGEALAHFEEALRLKPSSAATYNNMANSLNQCGRHADAVRHFRQAIRLDPASAEMHANLGLLLMDLGLTEDAAACFQQVLRIRPQWATAHLNMAAALGRLDDLEGAVQCCQEAVRLQPDLLAARSNLVSSLNLIPDLDQYMVFAEHRDWGELCAAKVNPQPFSRDRNPDRRLRIGYISGDFRLHALRRYLEPVLVHHDPQQVEIFCYAEVPVPDAGTKLLRNLANHWRSTCKLPDQRVAQMIRDDKIDILVDLAGHTNGNRLPVLAHKPAPVQATWLGYMNTTGLHAIDYRITDDVLDPPGQPVRDTEELWRLPNGFCCFTPPADAPPVTPLPAERNGYLTFGSLNNLIKHNSKVFDLWSEVLHALPTARLLMFRHTLTDSAQQRIRKQFAERGIHGDRLDLRQGVSTPGYLSVYDQIDIGLDTFPCTGGVTTCEALWMGVPVLSLCGERPAGRNSAAILARVGLSDFVVPTPAEFVQRAVRAATEIETLAQIRHQLRERMSTTVCDGHRFTRELEGAYRAMWRRWCG